MKKNILMIFLILLVVSLAACSGATEADTAESPGAEEATGKAAVILTGPHEDFNWNQGGYNGAKALEAQGYEVAISENISDTDVEGVLRQYAEDGYDFIHGHSFSYQDAVFKVAAEYPEVNFMWGGGINRTADNVADFALPWYEPAYAIGIIAGHMSETGVLGAIHGFDIPDCHAQGEAMLAGALTVNPDATLIHTAVGDWLDVAKAKEAALSQADAGVDFWLPCGEGPALGALAAAQEAGGYISGQISDMTEAGPDVVLVSLIHDMEPALSQAMEDTMNGTFDNPFYDFRLAEGATYITYNEALKDQIPAEAIQAVEDALEAIKSGDLVVDYVSGLD